MSKKILYIAEIVTKVGVYCIKKQLQKLKTELNIDFIIANADGATGGFGLGASHSVYLRKLGIDVITSGDHIYNKKDIHEHMSHAYHLLRPANFPYSNPGRGWRTYHVGPRGEDRKAETKSQKIVVISLLGQATFKRIHPANPYTLLTNILDRAKSEADIVIVDFHALTTAEKAAMSLHADGLVSAVIGSGMRVQTADARILPKGTAVISDAGRSGSIQSVGGFDPKIELEQRMLGIPRRSFECWDGLEVQGVVLHIADDGRAESIEPFRIPVEPPPPPPPESEQKPKPKQKSGQKPEPKQEKGEKSA